MNQCYSIDVAKKILEKAIINELYKKGVIDFYQCNSIIKRLDEDVMKIEIKDEKTNKIKKENMTVKIPI